MSYKKDSSTIGSIYGDMLNKLRRNVVNESKHTKVPVGEIGESPLTKGGPQNTGGYMETKLDKNKLSKKELDDNYYNIGNLSYADDDCCDDTEEDEEEFSEETKKIAQNSLNTFMRKRSIFDKLFENAMNGSDFGGQNTDMDETQELDALGIEGGDDEDMDDLDVDMEEGGDEVTITIPRDLAVQLHSVLADIIGGEEEVDEMEDDFDGGDDLEGDDFGDDTEDEECDYDMDEDEEDLGHPNTGSVKNVDMGKNNKVGNVKPKGGTASSAYTNKVGADGDHGHSLVNAKQPNMGKNNKVGNLKTGKSLFD
jgi:hypothetical protein